MDDVLTLGFWASVLAGAIRLGTPLLFPTLGEIICERAGVLNLGQEGILLVGSLGGYMGAYYAGGDAWIGLGFGVLAGGLFSLIHAFLTINLKADQVISGVMLVLLGMGLTDFVGVAGKMAGQVVAWRNNWAFQRLDLTPWENHPNELLRFLDKVVFDHDLFVYLAVLLVPLIWFFLFKTHLGVAITAAGESPESADTLGIPVNRVRYLCVFLGGLLAGAGGAYISLVMLKSWTTMMTAGRGWIAVALVIFAFWKPQRAIWGAYLFGGIESLQGQLQAANVPIPVDLISMLPYLATIVVLVVIGRSRALKRTGAPSALGLPYERGAG